MSERKSIIKCALYTRIGIILLQYVSNLLIPDHKAEVFEFKFEENGNVIDNVIRHFLSGFLRWDAHYFTHISIHGYTYENTVAFFPLYPFIIKLLTYSQFLFPFYLDTLTLFCCVVFNIFIFIQSALCLFDLSCLFFKRDLAFKAALLFCYNPASIFFSAPYTECLFSYLTFKSMLNSTLLYRLYKEDRSMLKSIYCCIFYISLSVLTRSNGLLNIGFLGFTILSILYKDFEKHSPITFNTVGLLFSGCFSLISCVIPFVLYQYYCYNLFCTSFQIDLPKKVTDYAELQHFILPGTFSQHNQTWCYDRIPMAYSYVQKHYWKVGFLKYYSLKQVPNFLLAFPMVFLIFWASFQYKKFPAKITGVLKFPLIYVFLIHASALTLFCVFNIHVQVTTRMMASASPVLYWFSALQLKNRQFHENLFKMLAGVKCYSKDFFILAYFLSYLVVGTVLFCNHLPWT